MKKRVLAMVLALGMTFGLAGCAGSDKATDTSDKKAESADTESKDELTTVKWNYGSSGNVLVTIAEEKGYFEDEGIKIEPVEATQNMDEMCIRDRYVDSSTFWLLNCNNGLKNQKI